ncbi:MAG: thioredoxin family protein [Planctomycetaceae bacterium]
MPDGRPAAGIDIGIVGEGHTFDGYRQTVTTRDNGTFETMAAPNMVYLLVVKHEKWSAEPITGFAVWPNQPIENLNFQLRPTTRIHGRITIGADHKPVPQFRVNCYQYGADANDLKGAKLPNPKGSNSWVQPTTTHYALTDADGRYEFFVGPGKFDIRGPNQNEVPKFEITNETEKTFDFHMPRPERGILKGLVVTGDPPRPVSGAKINAISRSTRGRGFIAITDDDGRFEVERSLHLTAIHAHSADAKLGALSEIDADTSNVTIALHEMADAKATLVDAATGEPLADREIKYGVNVYIGPTKDAPFQTAWGGTKITDSAGRFTMEDLVLGGDYQISVTVENARSWRNVGSVKPTEPGTIDLGKLELKPYVPYKPPTIEERISSAFTHAKTPIERFEASFPDVKLSRQRVLMLLTDAAGEPAKQFMTLRFEDDGVQEALYDFRVIPINSSPPHDEPVKLLAEKFDEQLTGEKANFFIILTDDDGKPIDTAVATDLSTDGKIDREKVLAFLQKNTLEPLDAKTLLDEALAQAKTENKRVIVQETATWCGPCWSLSRFLQQHRDLWETDYIWVKMDHRWTGAQNLMAELRQEAEAGVPWWAILDADGKILVTSNTPEGNNIGFPSAPAEIEHFRTMVEQTAQRMTTEQIKKLVGDLQTRE